MPTIANARLNLATVTCTILGILISVPALAQPARVGVEARGTVVVGADGNGVFTTSFPTTLGGEDTRYFLALQETTQMESRPFVSSIVVSLNEERVLTVDDATVEFPRRIQVALTTVGGEANTLLVTAQGAPGSAARFAVVAERDDRMTGGRSVLPLGLRAANQRLAIHNAGTNPVAYRLTYFNRDGTTAGSSAPAILPPHASTGRDAGAGAPSAWRSGAVYVEWVSRGAGAVTASDGATVLDASPSEPVGRSLFDAVSGGLLAPPSAELRPCDRIDRRRLAGRRQRAPVHPHKRPLGREPHPREDVSPLLPIVRHVQVDAAVRLFRQGRFEQRRRAVWPIGDERTKVFPVVTVTPEQISLQVAPA